MDWELGVNRCKLLLLEWISNEILLCSSRNYVSSLMMEHDNLRKKNVYMYVQLGHHAVQQGKKIMYERNKKFFLKRSKTNDSALSFKSLFGIWSSCRGAVVNQSY